jgi:colanic acid/amylovoran biosynthesis glycosyltransferase
MRSRLIALGAPPERVVKLPAGVKLERFAFRERTLLPGDDIRILTVARLVEAKGIDIALRAIHRLRGRFPRIRYEIVDDGPLKDAWTGLSRDLGLIERVRWHGALSHDRLREVYAAAHMFILPSRVARDGAEEGQGLVLAEAQATGLPVVAARIGGIPESIVADESGLLVEESDDAAFAQAIAGLLEHPEEWPRMGHKGREHVERHFSQDNLTDRLLSLYEEVARAGRSAPAKLG